jgi:hypothetical protein
LWRGYYKEEYRKGIIFKKERWWVTFDGFVLVDLMNNNHEGSQMENVCN